jgi:wyosine [tRNA(Phe)-imidazoG37] synthetase (radical SAM superfamily)
MATFLFDEIIFGPVKSRRLGVSLGINLLPTKKKICNFNCIYCECGLTEETANIASLLPNRKDVFEALDKKLSEMKDSGLIPDVMTYAGNGEPTLHPEFAGIIDDSIMLREKYFPNVKIAVLSNATRITNPEIRAALLKADMNILKLDSALNTTVKLHNNPKMNLDVEELIQNLASFNGKVIIQTLFLKGDFRGIPVDNTTPEELEAWLSAIKRIQPEEVMIYTISRDTPSDGNFEKASPEILMKISALVEKLGIKTQVSF